MTAMRIFLWAIMQLLWELYLATALALRWAIALFLERLAQLTAIPALV